MEDNITKCRNRPYLNIAITNNVRVKNDPFLFSGYVKIFSHNTEEGLFESRNEALTKNCHKPGAKLFSHLDKLEEYRGVDGNFQFKLCFLNLDNAMSGLNHPIR